MACADAAGRPGDDEAVLNGMCRSIVRRKSARTASCCSSAMWPRTDSCPKATESGWPRGYDADLTVMSEIADSLFPSTVPSVVIHTTRYCVGDALSTVMVLEPVFMGVGDVSSVVSSSVAGVADCADRS